MKNYKTIYIREASGDKQYSKQVKAVSRKEALVKVRDYAQIPAKFIKSCRLAEKRW